MPAPQTIEFTSPAAGATVSAEAVATWAEVYAAADLVTHDFENGSLFVNGTTEPYRTSRLSSEVFVTDDPTGAGRGKVVQIVYAGNQTREFLLDARPSAVVAAATTFGETLYNRGSFYIPTPPAGSENCLRKLFYWFSAIGTSTGFIVVGEENGNLFCELSNNGTSQRQTISPTTSVAWDTWHSLELGVGVNTVYNVADGWIKIWFNGTLVCSVTGLILLSSSANAPDGNPDRFELFSVGDQVSGGGGGTENRYWDDVAFSTTRIGP